MKAKTIPFFTFLLICGALGAIFGIRFEGNDDEFINLLAVGAFGPQSQYLVHMNTAYGFLLKGLFALFPALNWYLLIMLLANLAGVFILASLAAEKLSGFFFSEHRPRKLLYYVVLISIVLCLLQDFLLFPQYTKSGMLYSAAGLILLLEYVFPGAGEKASGKRSGLIPGTFFCALGLCFRLKCFLFLLPFFGLGVLFGLLFRKEGICLKGKALVLPAALLLFLTLFDHFSYASDPGWASFRRYNTLREDVMDYGTLLYEKHSEAYREAGILPEELSLLASWNYGDTERFNADRLEQIKTILYADNAHGLSFGPWVFRVIPEDLLNKFSANAPAVLTALMLLVLLFFGTKPSRLMAVGALIILLGELWYLSCMGRVEWRAEIGAYLGLLFFCVWGLEPEAEKETPKKYSPWGGYLLIPLFLLTALWSTAKVRLWADTFPVLERAEAFFSEKDPDSFYLGGSQAFLIGREIETNPFRINGDYAGYFQGFCFLGGWMIPSPTALYYANEAGFSNPLRAITERNVLFAGTEEEARMITAYLRAVYDEDYSPADVGEIDGIRLWSFRQNIT